MRFSTFNSSKHCTPVVVDAGVNLQVTCSPSSLSPFPANLPEVPLFTSGGLGLVIWFGLKNLILFTLHH